MAGRDFRTLLEAQWGEGKFLCPGLDPDIEKIPQHLRALGAREAFLEFNRAIIDATKDIVAAYKPNSAFYEAAGSEGILALKETIAYLHTEAPGVPVIYDAKRADIGNTNQGYVHAAFDYLEADAITVHPYMGGDSLREFLDQRDKGIFVMCRNSNPGAGEFQDLAYEGKPLYLHLAESFRDKWNTHGNCGLVVGATYPEEVGAIRAAVPDMTFLIPGIGAQGGDLALSVANGKDARGAGFLISTARVILYASSGEDFAAAARAKTQELHDAIRKAL
jgi:orotidine-5'-phosphate decarboxylase